ncbi:energy transducer TonB [Sphingobacterium litopenaei]|uniref:Energy transducer TonB n=1 Tax=Sphingobacterium litopenaei TaxID=2763500 RepID=A0ABR7YEJ8_9SPHI|nr:energy transducer TonB [Sphingobacterium litopenaei]MBD1429727.1 energy transducer TonB [Sphingobacterium litopenaei]
MMFFKSLIFSKDWTDIVFANRNKEYGAYQLRQMSGKATNMALLIVAATVGGLCGISFVSKSDGNDLMIVKEEFSPAFEVAPELELPEEIITPEPKEEKAQQVAKDVSARDLVKYTEINPTDKTKTSEEIATETEVLDKNKLLASFNAKGQKGGELITRGTFGTKKQDGGTLGKSTGDVDGTNAYGNEPFTSVEIMPEPIGGMKEFINWISKNYTFTQSALDNEVKGLIQVKFVVEKDGSLSSFEVERDMGYGTGNEAIKLLKTAKKWNPGIQNGQRVRVAFSLPIRLATQ